MVNFLDGGHWRRESRILILWRARGTRTPSPLAVFVVAVPVIYYATHASLRYRHPIDPIVMTLTAIVLTGARRTEIPRSGAHPP